METDRNSQTETNKKQAEGKQGENGRQRAAAAVVSFGPLMPYRSDFDTFTMKPQLYRPVRWLARKPPLSAAANSSSR